MAIVRSTPSRYVSPFGSEFGRLFSTFFDTATPVSTGLAGTTRGFVPALDIVEHDEDYRITVDLPGLSEDDVKVEILDGTLSISGERAGASEQSKDGYRRIERTFGRFNRSLTLPKGVDATAVHAGFKNGVLEVTVPKPETAKPQQVQIAVEAAA